MNYSDSIPSKIFIVGCPRSGTTLLQSILAAHPKVLSFPESHFFEDLTFRSAKWKYTFGILGITPIRIRNRLRNFFHQIEYEQHLKPAFYTVFRKQYCEYFVNIVDAFALQQNKLCWIEKTPENLHHIPLIEKLVPSAKFIHIVRNAKDVVASLYEVSRRYPDPWGGPWEIDACIDRWLKDINISYSYADEANHLIVFYEKLVSEDSHTVTSQLCDFCGVEYHKDMLTNYRDAAVQLITEKEPWKDSNVKGIKNRNEKKFSSNFDEEQRKYIVDRLKDTDIPVNDAKIKN